MRPPDPVTMAMGMERCTIAMLGCHSGPSAGGGSAQDGAQLLAVLGDPAQEIGQHGLRPAARAHLPGSRGSVLPGPTHGLPPTKPAPPVTRTRFTGSRLCATEWVNSRL